MPVRNRSDIGVLLRANLGLLERAAPDDLKRADVIVHGHEARHPARSSVTRFAIDVPEGQQVEQTRRSIAISPRGDRIAYSAGGRLFLRSLADFEAQPLPGTAARSRPRTDRR
jgi:hypothetical protein